MIHIYIYISHQILTTVVLRLRLVCVRLAYEEARHGVCQPTVCCCHHVICSVLSDSVMSRRSFLDRFSRFALLVAFGSRSAFFAQLGELASIATARGEGGDGAGRERQREAGQRDEDSAARDLGG